MSYFKHLLNNYHIWKQYKSLPKVFQRADGMFPSETYFKYPPENTFKNKKTLNLGCGKSIFRAKNVVNADVVPGECITVIDPAKSLTQFGTDFDFIIANHVIEHIPNWFERFKEMAEILKPGGSLEIWIPPVSADTSMTFRDHINLIGLRSFDGVGPGATGGHNALASYEFAQFTHLKKLQLVQHAIRPIIKWWTMLVPESVLNWMVRHLRNIVSEEGFFFIKGE